MHSKSKSKKVTKDLDVLIFELIDLETEYGKNLERGDHKEANANVSESKLLYREILKFGTDGKEKLIELLDHKNPYVRGWASISILPFAPQKGLARLRKLAGSSLSGLAGANAAIVLDMWEKGQLMF